MRLLEVLLIALSLATAAWSQAAVEHAAMTAASSTGTAATVGPGKSIGNVFDGLNKKLESAKIANSSAPRAKAPAQTSTTVTLRVRENAPPRLEPKPVDPSRVTIGLEREELLKRCGEPSMSSSQTRNSQLVETYWYNTTANEVLTVTLRDGKVASITPPPVQINETAGANQR